MVHYRRNLIAGGTFFLTPALANRASSILTDHVALLRTAFRLTRREHPFTIEAIVILPDHMHIVMTLPAGDADFPIRMSLSKRRFTASRFVRVGFAFAQPTLLAVSVVVAPFVIAGLDPAIHAERRLAEARRAV
jgi:REP element-mobilizing transposase RayT